MGIPNQVTLRKLFVVTVWGSLPGPWHGGLTNNSTVRVDAYGRRVVLTH